MTKGEYGFVAEDYSMSLTFGVWLALSSWGLHLVADYFIGRF